MSAEDRTGGISSIDNVEGRSSGVARTGMSICALGGALPPKIGAEPMFEAPITGAGFCWRSCTNSAISLRPSLNRSTVWEIASFICPSKFQGCCAACWPKKESAVEEIIHLIFIKIEAMILVTMSRKHKRLSFNRTLN